MKLSDLESKHKRLCETIKHIVEVWCEGVGCSGCIHKGDDSCASELNIQELELDELIRKNKDRRII